MAFKTMEFQSFEEAAARLAKDMSQTIALAIQARAKAKVALSGGNTPKAVLPLLGQGLDEPLDWSRVTFTLTDERWVPTNHSDSNEALCKTHLPADAQDKAAFVGFYTGQPGPGTALGRVRGSLRKVLPLDAAFLGMGADGHTASLFADDKGWRDLTQPLRPVLPYRGRQARLSLSLHSLGMSRSLFLMVNGKAKKSAFDKARRAGPEGPYPIGTLLHHYRGKMIVYTCP